MPFLAEETVEFEGGCLSGYKGTFASWTFLSNSLTTILSQEKYRENLRGHGTYLSQEEVINKSGELLRIAPHSDSPYIFRGQK